MEFTEVQELNHLTTQSRTFQAKQFLPDYNDSNYTYRTKTMQTPIDPLLDYERALEDTPPQSPSKFLSLKKGINPALIEEGVEESIEELLGGIRDCLQEHDSSANIPVISIKPVNKEIVETTDDTEVIQEEKAEDDKAVTEEEAPEKVEENTEDKEDEDEEAEDEKTDKVELANNNQFGKIGGDDISKTYQETKNIKSFLSNSIKSFPMNRQEYTPAKRGETKTFRVYFLTREFSTIIPLSLTLPITEIIKYCLENFKLKKEVTEFIKYPDRPDAYDLKRDAESGPFEKNKTLKEYKLSQELTLVESETFDPSKPVGKPGAAGKADKNAMLTITILFPADDRTRLTVQMAPDRQVKDIFPRLALEGKVGFTLQAYNVRIYSSDMEARFRDSKNFLDANIPLKGIKHSERDEGIQLELVKKKFADEPNEPPVDGRNVSPQKRTGTIEIHNHEQQEEIFLYNPVTANQYEEFEVTKINENNKRQVRILGIDGFKLYNFAKSYKQEQAGGIGEIFNKLFFSEFGVRNPERLLTDVVEAHVVTGNLFKICIRAEGREKWTTFEASDAKTANQIIAKLKFLKASHEKKINN